MLFLMYLNFKFDTSSLLCDFIKIVCYKMIHFPLEACFKNPIDLICGAFTFIVFKNSLLLSSFSLPSQNVYFRVCLILTWKGLEFYYCYFYSNMLQFCSLCAL